jgi:hypothetical protein
LQSDVRKTIEKVDWHTANAFGVGLQYSLAALLMGFWPALGFLLMGSLLSGSSVLSKREVELQGGWEAAPFLATISFFICYLSSFYKP